MRSCQHPVPESSTALLAAQERLLAIRRELNIEPGARTNPAVDEGPERIGCSWLLHNGQRELQRRRRGLPGIELTRAGSTVVPDWIPQEAVPKVSAIAPADNKSATVAVYPSLLLAMLKQDQAAAGRVYLLLRYLDKSGRGWLPINEIRERLTRKGSPLKAMGWRRLRMLLHQGSGVFWERDEQGRLWLRSAPRIALELGCHRLKGKRVELPISALLGGIGTVRAHFYASFHSGRRTDNPISRDTLEDITGLSPRTQRDYDRRAQVKRQRNMAVGPKHTKISAEEQYWQRGGAVFRFVDSQGKQGPKNREYLAWQMPNTYQAPHQQRSKGRQKKINQQLLSLVNTGVRGTEQHAVDKLFWPDGATAGKAYSRDQELDAYWPRGETRRRKGAIWYVLMKKAE